MPRHSNLNGVVVVDKPAGMGSSSVVDKLRKLLGEDRIGHTGTLDPIATGVLPLCIGHATKLAGYLIAQDKRYVAIAQLGAATDTQDCQGVVTATADPNAVAAITEAHVRETLASLVGTYEQLPPMYSAVKVAGRRLYESARAGEVIERPTRTVTVFSLELVALRGSCVEFAVHCGKGTYVRTIIDELGMRIGVYAHMLALRRTQTGRFGLEKALTREQWSVAAIEQALIPIDEMTDLPRASVLPQDVPGVKVGRPLPIDRVSHVPASEPFLLVAPSDENLVPGRVLAVVHIKAGFVRYLRVFKEDY